MRDRRGELSKEEIKVESEVRERRTRERERKRDVSLLVAVYVASICILDAAGFSAELCFRTVLAGYGLGVGGCTFGVYSFRFTIAGFMGGVV